MAAKLCYSDATIDEIKEGLKDRDISKYIKILVDMGHMSVIEHTSFTLVLRVCRVRFWHRLQGIV